MRSGFHLLGAWRSMARALAAKTAATLGVTREGLYKKLANFGV